MTNEQAQNVLDELQCVRPEKLNGEAKRLFEAIMKIADERDELKKELKKKDKQIEKYQNMLVTNDMLHIKESQEKDEIPKLKSIIDLMAEKIFEEGIIWDNKEEIKQYFKNKAREV